MVVRSLPKKGKHKCGGVLNYSKSSARGETATVEIVESGCQRNKGGRISLSGYFTIMKRESADKKSCSSSSSSCHVLRHHPGSPLFCLGGTDLRGIL